MVYNDASTVIMHGLPCQTSAFVSLKLPALRKYALRYSKCFPVTQHFFFKVFQVFKSFCGIACTIHRIKSDYIKLFTLFPTPEQ